MAVLMGIDLGTSSVKTVLMHESGSLMAIAQQEYSFDIPREGWAEQDPETWWKAAVDTIRSAMHTSGVQPEEIRGIGFSGQMHGLVMLDGSGKPVRKAIIWCDQRTKHQVDYINQTVGEQRVGEIVHSPVAVGFMGPSLLWMKEHEPDMYRQTARVVLPKDYIRFKLTGTISTDISDAASTTLLDVSSGRWSDELINALGFRQELFPDIHLPDTPAGEISFEAADVTGLKRGTPVVHGGADQVMQAVGNGIVTPGTISVTIGTGGQVLSPLDRPLYDSRLRAHGFNFLTRESWYFMGASLSAGLSLRWLRNILDPQLPYREVDRLASQVPPGSEGLLFLPYLGGERTPHMDAHARGIFFGMTLNHKRSHLLRSVMEGVVFALKDSLNILINDLGQPCSRVIASGGGMTSSLWLQMQADILQQEIYISNMKEQAGVGAAITAGVGTGLFESYQQACSELISLQETPTIPDASQKHQYQEYYELYRQLYGLNRDAMHTASRLSRERTGGGKS